MVDTTDLKSVDLIGRVGSSPTTPSYYVILLDIKNTPLNKTSETLTADFFFKKYKVVRRICR